MSKTRWVCNICGLSLPHVEASAISYHKEQVKANRDARRQFTAQYRNTWATNHRHYQAPNGYWYVAYRRSESDSWHNYQDHEKPIRFLNEFQAKDFLERKRLDALYG